MKQKHVFVEKHNDVAVLTIGGEQKDNFLNKEFLDELAQHVATLEKHGDISCVIIMSAKDNFMMGADLNQLKSITSPAVASTLVKHAQTVFNAIEASQKTYICAIHGACTGCGLELALACHVRIATLSSSTTFVFPEIGFGFLPAAGATQRLPRLIGLTYAMPILFGKHVTTKAAESIGLIDLTVEKADELYQASLVAARGKRPREKRRLFGMFAVPQLFLVKRKLKNTSNNAAAFAIIDAVQTGILRGMPEGLERESVLFGQLQQSSTSKNLVDLYFAQKAREKKGYSPGCIDEHVGIIGSGLMGSGIAYVSLLNNFAVSLHDCHRDRLASAENFITQGLNGRLNKQQLSTFGRKQLLEKLTFSHDIEPIARCPIIIEAVVEDLGIKQKLIKEIESSLSPHAFFATNTSSIPIKDIAAGSTIKDRIVGMHYFSPVHKMPLLEIVKSPYTSEETLNKACALGTLQKKSIIIVNDGAGFYKTRIISAMLDEAMILITEGVKPHAIDASMKEIGFAMGPCALMDHVGIDVCLHVSRILHRAFGERVIAQNLDVATALVNAGILGKKSDCGFYRYDKHCINAHAKSVIKPFVKNNKIDPNTLCERMLSRLINEATYAFSENIITNTEDGDVGAVLGIGFPAHLGGPFKYIASQSKAAVIQTLDRLRDDHGPRFNRSAMLR